MKKKRFLDKGMIIAWIVMFIYIFSIFIPFFFAFLTSLKPINEIIKYPVDYFSFKASFDSYYQVIFGSAYGKYILNTLIVSLSVVILCAFFGIPSAYALARYKFSFKKSILFFIISIRLIPPISLIVPFFILIRFLRLVDSLFSLIMVNFMLNLPFFIWISWGFIKEIPREFEEAGLIDGCSRLESLWKIIIPIAVPGLSAASIVTFLFTWNEYLFALTFSQTKAAKTVSVGMSDFVGDVFVRWNQISAASMISIIPALIFVFLFQRYIVQGLTAGGIKG